MSSDCIRIGLIGVTHRAGIAKNWDQDPRAQIVAGADIHDEALSEFREEYSDRELFLTKDYHELVARDDIDAIGVFTPDDWHARHAIAALDAGKDTFTEKPMSISTDDCDAMLEAWKRSGKRFMVGMNMRYMDSFLTLKQIMESGEIGDIKAVAAQPTATVMRPAVGIVTASFPSASRSRNALHKRGSAPPCPPSVLPTS